MSSHVVSPLKVKLPSVVVAANPVTLQVNGVSEVITTEDVEEGTPPAAKMPSTQVLLCQDYEEITVKTEPENVLNQQYEYKIRPCIDLIDSLRSLGVEKDLGLPAIAVIGDQSSGKSSVLEALSGVCLPRGSGIVTRCPLVLRLKKSSKGSKWTGEIKYRDQKVKLKNPGEVEHEVRKAQDCMAGAGYGVSEELITLEVISPNVPDLTLIDLPGITRVALANQEADIGQKIKRMISKYIMKQETINLVVVPSNVDIATTEALEMAKIVDPSGQRTLGILTKPDLVDNGAEEDIVNIVRNLVYQLRKGYMIVKCRGQKEILNNVCLEDAIRNERAFFENHEHFSVLLNEGYATIPSLAEKLTIELVDHISQSLPTLEHQIKEKRRKAEERLKVIGTGVPESEMEKASCLINKIKHFGDELEKAVHGEEDVSKGSLKLFTSMRRLFNSWERSLKDSADNYAEDLRDDIKIYEEQHRGREMTGFVNFRTFENIAKKQIQTYEDPAIVKLNEITELVRKYFDSIASRHFEQFPNLYRSAKGKLENICGDQQKEAENVIQNQFRMEDIIYCQDSIYGRYLKAAREDATKFCFQKKSQGDMHLSIVEMSYHLQAYFKNTIARLASQIPLIIQHYVLRGSASQLQTQMILLIQDKENLNLMLQEKQDLSTERKSLKGRIDRLQKAQRRLARFPN
ncbi:interferon-induced GTP-binding protein Mx2-like [Rana temporaria]|uniref:interferon-induced GTP-binding protein Mx2-like n=1 Tax=Rana temporaria TaxID=8407 RepID=UPI001AAC790C|nr:interferon-induced GTP-binding protein Mx2-like [Rana temporaria]XP_040194997.1 interferon-induced GTP-binding protein Mx2-like [Rana temporaria]XP_040194998.1 interferon-induced GTP-binding protein Mx2-like [Rana temporaria]